jgi:hypothetical protein
MKQTLLLTLLFFINFSLSAQYSQRAFDPVFDRIHSVDPELKIYPNPATDFISLSHDEGIERLVIYNLVGRRMKSFAVREGGKYMVSDMPKGMYLVQLLGARDKIITTQRLHKQ